MNGFRQRVLACDLEASGPQATTRCYKKNESFAQIDVQNLDYTKLNRCVCVCVFFVQNKNSKWATWKFESENITALA